MTRKANDITTDITANDTASSFAVHYGEGINGRYRGFRTHRAAARFANAYLRGNSKDAFAWIYAIKYRADGRVFLIDTVGEIAREIPADLLK